MKQTIFVLLCVCLLVVMSAQFSECLADRSMLDQLFSNTQVIDSDSKEKSKTDADSAEDTTPNPDPFAAERAVVLKGAANTSLLKKGTDSSAVDSKKPDGASADENVTIGKTIKESGKDQKDDTDSLDEKSLSGNSKKQPSMYYYQ